MLEHHPHKHLEVPLPTVRARTGFGVCALALATLFACDNGGASRVPTSTGGTVAETGGESSSGGNTATGGRSPQPACIAGALPRKRRLWRTKTQRTDGRSLDNRRHDLDGWHSFGGRGRARCGGHNGGRARCGGYDGGRARGRCGGHNGGIGANLFGHGRIHLAAL